ASSLFRPRRFAPANGGGFLPPKCRRLPRASSARSPTDALPRRNHLPHKRFAVRFPVPPPDRSRVFSHPGAPHDPTRQNGKPHRRRVRPETSVHQRRSPLMLSQECVHELRSAWLPNLTDDGLDHLIDLLEKNSPLLIHGCFTRAVPMGCLATHAGWHHPRTA